MWQRQDIPLVSRKQAADVRELHTNAMNRSSFKPCEEVTGPLLRNNVLSMLANVTVICLKPHQLLALWCFTDIT